LQRPTSRFFGASGCGSKCEQVTHRFVIGKLPYLVVGDEIIA
jgi:hypothetical protein